MADEHIFGIVILARSIRMRPFINPLSCSQTHRTVAHFKVVYSHLPIHSRVVIYHELIDLAKITIPKICSSAIAETFL
jgi:hypothetical protein